MTTTVQQILEIATENYNDGDIDGLKLIIDLCNDQLQQEKGLAQKILEIMLHAENELDRNKVFYLPSDVNRYIDSVSLLTQSMVSIKELCQEEVNKQ